MTLIYISSTIFEMWTAGKWWELVKHAQVWILYTLILAIKCDHCDLCIMWPWPLFQGQTFTCSAIAIKNCAGSVWPRQICLNTHGLAVELLLFSERWNKHYYCHQIGSHLFAIEWRHCECCTSWPWPIFSNSWNFWKYINIQYLEIGERWELAKKAQELLLWRLILAIEWRQCECCTSWPLPIFSRSQFLEIYLKIQYLENGES